MYTSFTDAWTKIFARSDAFRHHIDPTKSTRPFCVTPYWVESRTSKFWKQETQTQIEVDATEPAILKLSLQVSFVYQ